MWRADAGRTASTAAALPENPKLLWTRELAPLTPAYRDARLQFDRGHEPIVVGKRLMVASSREDCVAAYDTETGTELWRAFADGPVRFAPVADSERVIFGADDGVVRCVAAATGQLVWQRRAVPSNRQALGNGRMISVWPVRGGPVLKNGLVYFAGGVWPLEGVFVYCVDAATGEVIWLNDRCGYIYGVHPHQAEAFGGVAPQGYLLIDGDDLVVPSSSAYPARFDLATGKLKEFQLPSAGRLPGGWFASTPEARQEEKLKRRGLLFDASVNAKRHEDKPWAEGLAGIKRSLWAGDRDVSFDDLPFAEGKIHSAIVADGKCFVATEDGRLSAFAAAGAVKAQPKVWKRQAAISKAGGSAANDILAASGGERGHGVIIGAGEPGLLESLIDQSHYRLLVLLPEDASSAAVRQRLTAAGLYGERVAIQKPDAALPPYFASFIAIAADAPAPAASQLARLYSSLRPYGGRLIGPESLLEQAKVEGLPRAKLSKQSNGLAVITREGALPGSANYTGHWTTSEDALVKAPVGVLWFDDALGHFKRSPQPQFIEGVMVSWDKDWLDASTRKGPVDYRLLPPMFSDVYTGRVLDAYEAEGLRQRFADTDLKTIQPNQYRPPTQKDDWKPAQPIAGMRTNPLTGEAEPRAFAKSYGCDGGFDYGNIYTMRSGTAAFYDKRVDSGTIHISGPRSGCTNSIVPANGVLNVPYFFEGCTCSYPLPMAVSLVSQPETFEQWMAWGAIPPEELTGKLQRVGINFGAPGDRKTEDGTLWLDYPSVGGPSPSVAVQTDPPSPDFYYRHSVWIEGGEGWPWVAASGAKGLRSVTVSGLKSGQYTVRLTFAEPDASIHEGARVFEVAVQDELQLGDFDVRRAGGGAMRAVTKSVTNLAVGTDGNMKFDLKARRGETIISGIEIIREGLKLGNLPSPALAPGRSL